MHLIKPLSLLSVAGLGVALYLQVDGVNIPNSYPIYHKGAADESYVYHSLNGRQSNDLSSVVVEELADEAGLDAGEDLSVPVEGESSGVKQETTIPESEIVRTSSTESSETPPTASVENEILSIEVRRGDSLIKLLRANGLSGSDTTSLIYRSGIKSSVFDISIGDLINVCKGVDGEVEWIEIRNLANGFNRLTKENGKWELEYIKYETSYVSQRYKFDLTSSLYVDAKAVGMNDTEVASLQGIFKDTINFSRLRAGTEFVVLSEKAYKNGKPSGESKILAVVIEALGTKHTAYLFEEDGESSYYDHNGDSLLPSFRRHPVDKVRITSHYNPNRKHPILKIVRPHRGTDYGGVGKPIKSIGDGVVKYAGKRGAFGNVVIIDHGNGIRSLSAHQRRFEKGIRTGVRVKKGQVIGFIGSTGLATGPHLHFELFVNGKHVDPLKYPLPMSSKVSNKERFTEVVNAYKETLTSAQNVG